MPPKVKNTFNIPDIDMIENIINAAKDTNMELPILLAVWLGFRASEICGLMWDCVDYDNKTITIKRAKVAAGKDIVLKTPKTYAGSRSLNCPDYILDLIKQQKTDNEYVVPMTGALIYKRFSSLLKKNNIQHCRFHDLRHANASIMLMLNIPDKYAMERIGHATNNMLQTIYQHTFKSVGNKYNDTINTYFKNILSHENITQKDIL